MKHVVNHVMHRCHVSLRPKLCLPTMDLVLHWAWLVECKDLCPGSLGSCKPSSACCDECNGILCKPTDSILTGGAGIECSCSVGPMRGCCSDC
eukprot:10997475-Karenia_brevis.AAC.1